MEKVQGLAAATLTFVTDYAVEHGLTSQEIMTALAHVYVIYGFTVKTNDSSAEEMKSAMIAAVSASADHMMTVERNEKA